MAPSNNLLATFAAAITTFNNAYLSKSKNYDDFKRYLNDAVYVDKVDDADSPVQTTPSDIVNYLNSNQVPNFPQLAYDPPHGKEHPTKKNATVTMGEVTGTGTYWDTLADYQKDDPAKPKIGIPIHYTLRFILNATGTAYLLSRALVVPI